MLCCRIRRTSPLRRACCTTAVGLTLLAPSRAVAEPEPAAEAASTPTGYIEAYYGYNVNAPDNGVTNYRGFDNRHNSFTLSNVVLGGELQSGPLVGKLLLQVGSTPSTYYASEPVRRGADGANATSAELWKYVQEARIGYRAPVGRGLLVEAGVFPSPIGIEVFAVKDNWNWSRSNLFFGLPFYHTGLRGTYAWSPKLSTSLYVVNGWNSVVDNNEEKSVMPVIAYKPSERVSLQALYMGGVERTTGSPEGPYWRHHVDAFGQIDVTKKLSLAAQADFGWEPNRFGTARWAAWALYTRVRPLPWLFVALRGDRFHEHLATERRSSAPIMWGGAEWVTSATATVDVRPHEHMSIRLELRQDVAAAPLYFERPLGTGLPDARTQRTFVLGVTAWL